LINFLDLIDDFLLKTPILLLGLAQLLLKILFILLSLSKVELYLLRVVHELGVLLSQLLLLSLLLKESLIVLS
jgi:hypothetical protein